MEGWPKQQHRRSSPPAAARLLPWSLRLYQTHSTAADQLFVSLGLQGAQRQRAAVPRVLGGHAAAAAHG